MQNTPDTSEAHFAASFAHPSLRQATDALMVGDLKLAERLTRSRLREQPEDLAALIVLADIAARIGIFHESERLLRNVVDRAPHYPNASINLALALFPQGRFEEAMATLDTVLVYDPRHVRAATTKADFLAQTGEYQAAEAIYANLLEYNDTRADVWMWYGHLLKTMGRSEDSIKAYRRASHLDPDLAEAWWSLAELKTSRLTPEDITAIEQAISRAASDEKRLFMHFALGKALEDAEDWAGSFKHYAIGNALRLAREPHDRHAVSLEVDQSIAQYTQEFFQARAGWGNPSSAPIFIVGLPRSGSTLLEQILSSHSCIEATAELPDIPLIAQALVAERWQDPTASYPRIISAISRSRAEELGHQYERNAVRHRKTAAPFFIDKLPNNWRHIGLIRLILPNARIIDARRDAMACCFSNFKQHFAQGQSFAYGLSDLGAYYRDYVRTMAHYGQIFPDRLYRFDHEQLLGDPERAIRGVLNFLALPFEPACLAPHQNRRPVRTASSEQVRRPINRDAVDQWRHYDQWLDPLREALGDAL